jgi:hypothetical protein
VRLRVRADLDHGRHALEDGPDEVLFYDPASPTTLMLLDDLPGNASVRPDGTFASSYRGVLPVLVILTTLAAVAITFAKMFATP